MKNLGEGFSKPIPFSAYPCLSVRYLQTTVAHRNANINPLEFART
jgi:hypothetical protein